MAAGKRSDCLFGTLPFTSDEQQRTDAYLRQKLNTDVLSRRPGPGGRRLTYLESCKAIEIANEAFGFNGWSCRIVDCNLEYKEKDGNGRWSVGYSAVVRIELKDGSTHEDVGFGTSDGMKELGAALEQSKKASISDARKRALRLFGEYLGNSCYDKEHIKDVAANRANNVPLQSPTSIKLENGATANATAAEPNAQRVLPPTSTAPRPGNGSKPPPAVQRKPEGPAGVSNQTSPGIAQYPPAAMSRPPQYNQANQFNPPPPMNRGPQGPPNVKQEPSFGTTRNNAYASRSAPTVAPVSVTLVDHGKRPLPQQQAFPRPIMTNMSPSMVNASPSLGFDRQSAPVCMYPGDPGVDLDDLRYSQFEFDANETNESKKHKS
ncbi:hypothetical protein SPRG_10635 [Saprolegnia parasitica CBS 223.65]|uniref:Uncharacterized protein n=1 Tax=Saprolegnia parasitica (strain CBS 223.65) TaxID=695850 RepID=A0A067CCG8_SAPPC|nr:hypothetical protein SPRG_10635 [Saprolegnia parasitica CBS 223.65]KDO24206.1 hypothetical protein SPRG_10635 [Saprolegnia parasitica CBS 223.65]|eukprot:XP_012205150.1 hypothetical protein SPRG_10635 [Saprolegnia parasitica CBS 223.65]